MKKKVIIYVRVSTEEQTLGYSQKAQLSHLTNFCKIKGWDIVCVFQEDYTAWKGFDRPEYNKLNEFIKVNKGLIDYILVTQWSRFSRDAASSYAEIKRLRKLGIEPNAAEQWIDFDVPENAYLLAFYLTAPQVENDRHSLRTKAGIRQGLKEGRHQSTAPFGYIMKDKYLIVDEQKAALVRYCFDTVAKRCFNSLEEVRRAAIEKGFPLTKQSFLDLLKKRIYTGKIKVPAKGDEPEVYVPGQHDAIIDESLFEEVQLIVLGKRKPYKGITKNADIPLIGQIKCPTCGRLLTGSTSRGGSGRHYPYYHCQRKYGCKYSLQAKIANEKFIAYLQSFEIKPEIAELYNEILCKKFQNNVSNIENEKRKLEKQIEIIDKNIISLEEKYIFQSSISEEVYQKYKIKLSNDKSDLVMKHATLMKMPDEFTKYMRFGVTLLGNVTVFYRRADVRIKKKLISSIFPEKLQFQKNDYRTTKLNSVFAQIIATSNDLTKKQSDISAGLSSKAPPPRLERGTP